MTRERVPAIDNGRELRPSVASYEWRRELVSRARTPGEVVTHPVAGPFRMLKASRSFLKTWPPRVSDGTAHFSLSLRFSRPTSESALTFCSKSICRAQSINSVVRPGGWLSAEIEREERKRERERSDYAALTVRIHRPGRDPVRSSGFV